MNDKIQLSWAERMKYCVLSKGRWIQPVKYRLGPLFSCGKREKNEKGVRHTSRNSRESDQRSSQAPRFIIIGIHINSGGRSQKCGLYCMQRWEWQSLHLKGLYVFYYLMIRHHGLKITLAKVKVLRCNTKFVRHTEVGWKKWEDKLRGPNCMGKAGSSANNMGQCEFGYS